MVMMTVMIVIVMVTVASALAVLTVLVVVMFVFVLFVVIVVMVMLALLVVMVMVVLALFVVIMMMVMLVASAIAIFIVVVMMVLVFVLIVIVVMLIVIVVMLVMIVVMMSANGASILFDQSFNVSLERGFLLERADKRVDRELIRRSGNDHRIDILLSHESESLLKLCVGGLVGVTEEHATCIFYLITEEFTEVLHIHFALVYINDGNRAVDLGILKLCRKHSLSNVRKLTNARGLDEDTVGRILLNDLLESLAEVSDERATDASRVHLGYLNSCIFKKSAVDADLAEFVLDKNYLFTLVCFVDKAVDERGLART